ncbi:MAG: type II secretion system protein [Patescibacteria group bacterium]
MDKKYIKKAGFIFLEILIAITIISVVFTILLGIGFSAINMSSSIKKQTQADFLAKEELEALRSYRDGTTWATNGLGAVDSGDSNPYYMLLDNGATPKWTLHLGQETIAVFTRYVVFDWVSRDPSTGYIQSAYNPSNRDAETVKVKVTVSWLGKISQVFAYLTNWQNK